MFPGTVSAQGFQNPSQPTGAINGGLICRNIEAIESIGEAYEVGNDQEVARQHLGTDCIVLPRTIVIPITMIRLVRTYEGASGTLYLVEYTDGQDVYYSFFNRRPPFYDA